MAHKPPLHSADDLVGPGVEATIAALDPPDSDAGLVSLARVLAAAIDRMTNTERAVMLGQTSPQLFRTLEALEKRAAVRRGAAAGKAVNPIQEMRRAHAARRSG
jgi:hypothetical protein